MSHPNAAGGSDHATHDRRGNFIMQVLRRFSGVAQSHNVGRSAQDPVRRAPRGLLAGFALVALAGLAGCNAMKLGYQQGDHLAYWWVDKYVDVSDEQEPLTREAIQRFFNWHRKDQLPEIAAVLQRAKAEVQQPVTAASVEKIQDDAQRLTREAFDQALPDVANLLLTLTPEQVERMEKKFAEGNDKYRKQFLRGDMAKRVDARFDKVMDYAKLIYGGFSRDQEKVIREAVGPVAEEADAGFQERVKRQQAWLALARKVQTEQPPKERVLEMLKRFGDQWQNPPGARAARREAANDAGVALTVTIANMTTPEQKKHAVNRFQGWIDDTQALMREGPAKGPAQAAN